MNWNNIEEQDQNQVETKKDTYTWYIDSFTQHDTRVVHHIQCHNKRYKIMSETTTISPYSYTAQSIGCHCSLLVLVLYDGTEERRKKKTNPVKSKNNGNTTCKT